MFEVDAEFWCSVFRLRLLRPRMNVSVGEATRKFAMLYVGDVRIDSW